MKLDFSPPRFCSACGTGVVYKVPADDNHERAVCLACNKIHYANPLPVVGSVPIWDNQVLLCRRNIEPCRGLWTLPGGYLELGETSAQGAIRETLEETGAHIEQLELYTVLNVVRVGQLHLYYRAQLINTFINPGPESIEARLFEEHQIPWYELAFETVRTTLKQFYLDRAQGVFKVYCADLS